MVVAAEVEVERLALSFHLPSHMLLRTLRSLNDFSKIMVDPTGKKTPFK